MAHIYNGTLLNQKKNDIGLFEETWVDLESVIESKVNQKEKNNPFQLQKFKRRALAQPGCLPPTTELRQPAQWGHVRTR